MTGMRYIPFEVCCYVHKRAPKSRTSGFLKSETGASGACCQWRARGPSGLRVEPVYV